jgi:hypothetical protein
MSLTALRHRLRDGVPLLAAVACLAHLVLAVAWLNGAGGNPSDPAVDRGWRLSLLATWGPRPAAWIVAGLAVAGLAGLAALRLRSRFAVVPAAAVGLVLAVLVPDYRLIGQVAYSVVLPLLRLTGIVPDGVGLWPWPAVHQGLLCLTGVLLLVAVSARRGSVRLDAAGRDRWTRRGRWAVAVAVAVPVGYAVTRFAWALDIPLGVTRSMLDELGDARYAGASLGAMAVGGAVLTLGLVQRWGEVFPRWMLGLAGRRVPVGLAVVPATLVAVIVTSAGLMFVRLAVTGEMLRLFPGVGDQPAAWIPEMFWPLWGVALAVAAHAYRVRRAGDHRVTATPARQSAPPASAAGAGTSDSRTHDISTASAGTR